MINIDHIQASELHRRLHPHAEVSASFCMNTGWYRRVTPALVASLVNGSVLSWKLKAYRWCRAILRQLVRCCWQGVCFRCLLQAGELKQSGMTDNYQVTRAYMRLVFISDSSVSPSATFVCLEHRDAGPTATSPCMPCAPPLVKHCSFCLLLTDVLGSYMHCILDC